MSIANSPARNISQRDAEAVSGGGSTLPLPKRAYNFDGIDDEVVLPTFSVSGEISFSVWYKSSKTLNQILFGDSFATTYYCNISGSNVTFFIQGTARVSTIAGNSANGAWRHLAISLSSSTLKTYLDGVEIGTFVDTPYSGNLSLVLGNSTTADAFYSGLMFDFRCYQFAFTPSDVSELYNLGRNSLLGRQRLLHFKCVDQDPVIAFDSSGNSRNGTKVQINPNVGEFHYQADDVPFSW